MYTQMGFSSNDNSENDTKISKSSSPPPSQTSLAFFESLTMPLVQEIVLSADVRCKECQKRITHVLSRMNAEADSVVVNVLEKKVTVTCTYPNAKKEIPAPTQQITASSKNRLAKFSLLRMIFSSHLPGC